MTAQFCRIHSPPTIAGQSLDQIVDLNMLKGKTAAEIQEIWVKYHENISNCSGAVLSQDEYFALRRSTSKK
jgi:hypothetical protein